MLELYKKLAEQGEDVLRGAVEKVSATGETKKSIHSTVNPDGFTLLARGFFETMETGRGPRKGTEKAEFEGRMLKWMAARGIGAGLTDKKKKQLARFFTLRINRDGDKTHKQGGREVYSKELGAFIDQAIKEVTKEFVSEIMLDIRNIVRAK